MYSIIIVVFAESSIEQELNRLKEKTIKDDQARKEVPETNLQIFPA